MFSMGDGEEGTGEIRWCSLWGDGVHWMEGEGVEVVVERAGGKAIVVMGRRADFWGGRDSGSSALGGIVQRVVSIKKEHCPHLRHEVSHLAPSTLRGAKIPLITKF